MQGAVWFDPEGAASARSGWHQDSVARTEWLFSFLSNDPRRTTFAPVELTAETGDESLAMIAGSGIDAGTTGDKDQFAQQVRVGGDALVLPDWSDDRRGQNRNHHRLALWSVRRSAQAGGDCVLP